MVVQMVAYRARGAAIAALLALGSPATAGDTAAQTAAAAPLPPAARDAAAAVDAFHAALRRGDTKAAKALLADDVLIFEEGRAERSKAEYALHHLAADAEYSAAVPGVVARRIGNASGDLAWIATEGRTKGNFRGTAVNQVTVETVILRRIGGTWRIAHIHWSSAQSSVE
jgi:ketosteroid isomerase-like protein